jgi:hypothetical protein
MKLQAVATDDDEDNDNNNNNNNNIPWKHAQEKSTCYEALVLHFVHYHSNSFISTTSTAPVVHRGRAHGASTCAQGKSTCALQ